MLLEREKEMPIKIWLKEEKGTAEFLASIPGYLKLNGDMKQVYYLSADRDKGNDNIDSLFLQQFLLAQHRYPIY